MVYPSYIQLLESGELRRRVKELLALYERCAVCPRGCGARRNEGAAGGACHSTATLRISSYGPHHGEEAPISGRRGSGAIFLTSCNLRCVFCQNDEISRAEEGREATMEEAAEIMLALQRLGCHNINWVTPTHYAPTLAGALALAAGRGLRLPVVYNTSAYDSLEVLRLLDGIVDLYMPDFKFWDPGRCQRYFDAPDYPAVARAALLEMRRQVGDLAQDADGIARRGLLVRHLVMPGALEDTRQILEWIARELSPMTYVNLMAQYRPCGEALSFPEIARRPTAAEMAEAYAAAREAGLRRLDSPGGA